MSKYVRVKNGILTKNGVSLIVPFAMITVCFALWGFANDVISPMVETFSMVFPMSDREITMMRVAFYLAYFVMAIPAALIIQRYTYKHGVIVGLSLFAIGSLMFLPACFIGVYFPFMLAYFVLTCGLTFLETSCNPYVYCMGSEETATQRLNLAQAFNPLGNLVGMFVAMKLVQARMNDISSPALYDLSTEQFDLMRDHNLSVLIQPYIYLGAVVIVLLVLIYLKKMPTDCDTRSRKNLAVVAKELFKKRNYRQGVVAQFFYEGAQITCWMFIIQYGSRIFMAEGMDEKAAELLAQKFNIAAMVLFTVSRFICTWLLKYIAPGRLLSILAIVGVAALGGVILFTDRCGIYCLVLVSGCLSLMFPTIYGIALRGVGDNLKFASAGLIMAILGGSVFPHIQALLIDLNVTILGIPATNLSFIVPLICLIVVALYGHKSYVRHNILHQFG